MEEGKGSENRTVQRVYHKIIWLGIAVHISQVIIFCYLRCPIGAYYNVGSVIFYFIMAGVVSRGCLRLAVSSIHLEVCVFVILCTVLGGWDLGLPLFLPAMASMIYFCPWKHKGIPYLFSLLEVAVYLGLWLYTRNHPPVYTHLEPIHVTLYHFYSAAAGFSIILFAALLSNLSASVTNKQLQAENKNLSKIANYDYLTGLMSRQFFLKQSEMCELGKPLAVALGDIDNFKNINDTYGHSAGDYVLHTVAQIFIKFSSLTTLSCRWGGEEFVFCFRYRTPEEARQELEQIKRAVEEYPFQYNKKNLRITITFGVNSGIYDGNIHKMIECADKLMYKGKQTGKNRIMGEVSSSDFPH